MGKGLDMLRARMREKALPPVQGPPEPTGTLYVKTLERHARPGSQRRCYNGCFPDSDWEMIWTGWEVFLTDRPISCLDFWTNKKDRKYKWERTVL